MIQVTRKPGAPAPAAPTPDDSFRCMSHALRSAFLASCTQMMHLHGIHFALCFVQLTHPSNTSPNPASITTSTSTITKSGATPKEIEDNSKRGARLISVMDTTERDMFRHRPDGSAGRCWAHVASDPRRRYYVVKRLPAKYARQPFRMRPGLLKAIDAVLSCAMPVSPGQSLNKGGRRQAALRNPGNEVNHKGGWHEEDHYPSRSSSRAALGPKMEVRISRALFGGPDTTPTRPLHPLAAPPWPAAGRANGQAFS